MTNPQGRSFLSYRTAARQHEARLLIEAQHERGIPTWQDIKNLHAAVIPAEIRQTLNHPDTANAILWLTPDVANSQAMRNDEIPIAMQRASAGDSFFLLPVLAGGAASKDLARLVPPEHSPIDINQWKYIQVKNDPATYRDIVHIANTVLEKRLAAIDGQLDPDDALTIGVYNAQVPKRPSNHLLIDWSHCFNNDKSAKTGYWEQRIAPAAIDLRNALAANVGHRRLLISGIASLPTLTLLGAALAETTQLLADWLPPGTQDPWSIRAERNDPGIGEQCQAASSQGSALAVLVDAIGGMAPDFNRARPHLPAFRAIVTITPPPGHNEFRIQSAAHAAEIAWRTREAIRRAREDYAGIRDIHLFTKVPAGLAFLIGQLLNPFGEIQLYDHHPDRDTPYQPAVRINPHALDLGLTPSS